MNDVVRMADEKAVPKPVDELNEWDEDEELGCVDLETRLDAAMERAFGK